MQLFAKAQNFPDMWGLVEHMYCTGTLNWSLRNCSNNCLGFFSTTEEIWIDPIVFRPFYDISNIEFPEAIIFSIAEKAMAFQGSSQITLSHLS